MRWVCCGFICFYFFFWLLHSWCKYWGASWLSSKVILIFAFEVDVVGERLEERGTMKVKMESSQLGCADFLKLWSCQIIQILNMSSGMCDWDVICVTLMHHQRLWYLGMNSALLNSAPWLLWVTVKQKVRSSRCWTGRSFSEVRLEKEVWSEKKKQESE